MFQVGRPLFLLLIGYAGMASSAFSEALWINPIATQEDDNAPIVETQTASKSAVTLGSAVAAAPPPGRSASVSGVSSPSGLSSPSTISSAASIERIVTPNAFRPPDLISEDQGVLLVPLRNKGWWDLSCFTSSALNYDSNVTRVSAGKGGLSDFYNHSEIGAQARLGTDASPFAITSTYGYSLDSFDQYDRFNTSVNHFDVQARVGRNDVVFVPFVHGRLEDVTSPEAMDSGRESYNYWEEGLHGQATLSSVFTDAYDFSHTTVSYRQRVGANFEIWRYYQEFDCAPFSSSSLSSAKPAVSGVQFFPWTELKQMNPEVGFDVNEINGGLGARFELNTQWSFSVKAGWGDVLSQDPSVGGGAFSSWRCDADASYHPFSWLGCKLDYDRMLSFTPTTVGRDVHVFNLSLESPIILDAHWNIKPTFVFTYSTSNDYQDPETSYLPQPGMELGYKMNDHFALFFKTQYSSTDDQKFSGVSHVEVLQSTIGITALF